MNNLYFIKRIDDLGRIVIPKDIRRKLKIEDNENMQISIENNEIILKKHSLLNEKEKNIINIGKIIYEILNKNIIIANREKIIYSNNNELINKEVSNDLKEYIINRFELNGFMNIELINNVKISSNFISKNIIIDSDASGIIIFYDEIFEEKDKLLLDLTSKLIYNI